MNNPTYQEIQTVRDIANDYATCQSDRAALLSVAQAASDHINMLVGLAMLTNQPNPFRVDAQNSKSDHRELVDALFASYEFIPKGGSLQETCDRLLSPYETGNANT